MLHQIAKMEAEAELARRLAEIGGPLHREEIARWIPTWRDSGIFLSAEAAGNGPEGIPIAGQPALQDDLVVLYRDRDPSPGNQQLHMVVGLGRDAEGRRTARLGPAIPHSEWPAPIRKATIPASVHAKVSVRGPDREITLVRSDGATIASLPYDSLKGPGELKAISEAIERAAWNGYYASADDRWEHLPVRTFVIERAGSRWVIGDDVGTSYAKVDRSLMQRRPPALAEAIRAAVTHAYTDGLAEGIIARKEARHVEAETAAPRM